MFDNVVVRPRRRKLKSVLVVGSAAVHAAVVASLAVAAMWKVDLVSMGPDKEDIAIAGPRPPAGAAALPAGARLPDQLRKPPKVKTHDVVQQPLLKSDPPPAPSTGGGDPAATGPADGPPGPPDAPPCTDPAGCIDDKGPPTPPEPPAVVTKDDHVDPPIIPPRIAKGLRERGDEQIFPSRTTQLAMLHDGKTSVRGTFRLCVDERGAVSSVRKLAGTGYADYDDALADAIRGWHYRPYLVVHPDRPADPPLPTAMCTVTTFQYRITN